MLYICSHQLTVLLRWQYNDYFVQPDLFLSVPFFFMKGACLCVCGFFFSPFKQHKMNTDLVSCDTKPVLFLCI